MILLLAVIVQGARANIEDHPAVLDQKADIWVDKLFGRSQKSWVLQHTDADSTTLGKLGTSANMPRTNPVMTLTRHATPNFAGYRSQYQTPIIPIGPPSYNLIPHAKSKSETIESAKSAAAGEAAVTDFLDSSAASPALVKKVQEEQAKHAAAVKRAEEAKAIAAEANAMLAAIEAEAMEAEAEAMLAASRKHKRNSQKNQEKKAEADIKHAAAILHLQEAEAAARAAEKRAAAAESEAEKWSPIKDADILQFLMNLPEELTDSTFKSLRK